MLPTHRGTEVPLSASAVHSIKLYVNKPSSRWLLLCLAFAGSLWFLGPYFLRLEGQFEHHPHGHPPHQNNLPVIDEHGRHPPRPGARPRPQRPVPTQIGSSTIWTARAGQVKDAYLHAWNGYQKLAAPFDELLPVSDSKVNNFNGWGVSLIDGLDTMWIMGLHVEFFESMPFVANMTFALAPPNYAPFFETVIRYLGGLLSAYALSGDPILLSRADDLGTMLLPAFNTTSGLPAYAVDTVSGKTRSGWNRGNVLWAEALSCQMEFKYLAHLTGRAQYYEKVEHIMQIMYNTTVSNGLFPTKWDIDLGTPTNKDYSVGAFGDSAYEYLLKQWLLTGKTEPKSRDLYLKSAEGIINNLLFLSPKRKLLYVTDLAYETPTHVFEHLSCFLPGLFALGAHTLDLSPKDKELHQWAAEGLAYTCYITYADQATKLGPDVVIMDPWTEGNRAGTWVNHLKDWEEAGRPGGIPPGLSEVPIMGPGNRDYSPRKPAYLLRPETVESFYILWKTTGDVRWRARGWSIFEAIEKETKTKSGYASIETVDASPSPMRDEMPSYFLAETLKYLYLLFSEDDLIPLDTWVFNTEGHPLPVYTWSNWERQRYHIP